MAFLSFWVRYRIARVRYFLREALPFAIALRLPRRIALFAFIRVYGALGYCGPDFDLACKAFERGEGR